MSDRILVFRAHALQRMFERRISVDEVRHVVETGEVIERYPDDRPDPSRLVLGQVAGGALHAVVADNTDDSSVIVITVYEPDPALWDETFRRRIDK